MGKEGSMKVAQSSRHSLLAAIAVIGVITLFPNCGGLSSKQRTAVDDAMKSLRKLAAATQVGVNYQQYGTLVIEAQAQVNDALAVLPEAELKTEMNAAMEGYADAGRVWSVKIDSRRLYSNSEPGQTLIPKYSLKTTPYYFSGAQKPAWESVDADQALQIIWGIARTHLDKASALSQ
jgi:hypothetical protein